MELCEAEKYTLETSYLSQHDILTFLDLHPCYPSRFLYDGISVESTQSRILAKSTTDAFSPAPLIRFHS